MSQMYDYYVDLIDPTDLYENWHQDMLEIAQENAEEKKVLINLFENEHDKKVKSWLAGILIDLREECVIPYLLDVAETDENLKERSWAGSNLVKLEFPHIKGILAGLLKKNQIDKSNLAWELFEMKSKFSLHVIDDLIKIDDEFFKKIHSYRDKEQRKNEFSKKWFYSKAEQMYEGIDCGALCLDLKREIQQIALESEHEREAAFEILGKETDLNKKYALAEALLKVDFERALGCLIYLIEDTDYNYEDLPILLMKLNHPAAIDAIKKVSFSEYSNYYINYFLDDFLAIQTPIAKKVFEYLDNHNPDWKELMKKYREKKLKDARIANH